MAKGRTTGSANPVSTEFDEVAIVDPTTGKLAQVAAGAVITSCAVSSALNKSGAASVVKASAGRCACVIVQVAGSAPGAMNDCATTGAVAAANQFFVIPNTIGIYELDWPCANGIVVTPGTGQTVAISYV